MLSATSRADADEVREAEHLEVSVDELGLPDFVGVRTDRKSTRLNSSHGYISYAVFCLKKKKKKTPQATAIIEQQSKTVHRCRSDTLITRGYTVARDVAVSHETAYIHINHFV